MEPNTSMSGDVSKAEPSKPPEIDTTVSHIINAQSMNEEIDLTIIRYVSYAKDVKNINTWRELAQL